MGQRSYRRRSPRRSFAALLIALGLLALQGPRLFHLLLVAHTTCEHGELVEVHRQRISTPHAQGAARDKGPAAAPGHADHADSADHDHCDTLALRHLPAEIEPAFVAPSLLTLDPALTLVERSEARPVPLLALAPKGSPPSA